MSNDRAIAVKELPDEKIPNFPHGLKNTDLYPFQRRGVLYMYFAKKCILADSTGLGKTVQSLALFKLLEHRKELNKWIIVVPSNALYQWETEFLKFTDYKPLVADGAPEDRASLYMFKDFSFVLISYQTLWRDYEMLMRLKWKNFLFDDAHFFKHRATKTARIIRHLTKEADRIVLTTATPVQKTLLDLQSLVEVLGLNDVFGNSEAFKRYYCIINRELKRMGSRQFWVEKVVGHQNISVLNKKIYPYILKRTFNDVGKELPGLMVHPLWLKLHPKQRDLYKQAKDGLIVDIKNGQSNVIAHKGFHSLMQVLAGTQTLGLEEDVSIKLDAVEFFIDEKLGEGDKAIVYSFYRKTVDTLSKRLDKRGIKYLIITGGESSKDKDKIKQLFTQDSSYRVLIGTGAIEVAMNLQIAKYMLMVDMIFNPQRIVQLIGRIRRLGSAHDKVVLYMLLTQGTIEEKLWKRLNFEAGIADCLFKEKSDVFKTPNNSDILDVLREP